MASCEVQLSGVIDLHPDLQPRAGHKARFFYWRNFVYEQINNAQLKINN